MAECLGQVGWMLEPHFTHTHTPRPSPLKPKKKKKKKPEVYYVNGKDLGMLMY
jgi:hypothetical protein